MSIKTIIRQGKKGTSRTTITKMGGTTFRRTVNSKGKVKVTSSRRVGNTTYVTSN